MSKLYRLMISDSLGEIESLITAEKPQPIEEILQQIKETGPLWKRYFADWRLVEA